MLTTDKEFIGGLQSRMTAFYATNSYDAPVSDYMEQTQDTPNDDEGDEERESRAADVDGAARRVALALWERKAITRLKRGMSAGVGFETEALEQEERDRVRDGLAACQTPEDVRAYFATILVEMPPVYHTTVEQQERQRIARGWRDRRLAAEREH